MFYRLFILGDVAGSNWLVGGLCTPGPAVLQLSAGMAAIVHAGAAAVAGAGVVVVGAGGDMVLVGVESRVGTHSVDVPLGVFVADVGVGNATVFVVSAVFPAVSDVGDIGGTGDATALRSGVGITMDAFVAVGISVAISSGAFMVSVLLVSSVLDVPLQSVLGLKSDWS